MAKAVRKESAADQLPGATIRSSTPSQVRYRGQEKDGDESGSGGPNEGALQRSRVSYAGSMGASGTSAIRRGLARGKCGPAEGDRGLFVVDAGHFVSAFSGALPHYKCVS